MPPTHQTDTAAADIVIIGGAIMGSAVAHFLAAHPRCCGRRIVVVERDRSYRDSATTRSAGGLRQQFSTPECIAMSQAGLALVRDLTQTFGQTFGADADVGFREQGYLLLASAAGAATLASNVALQRRLGADIQALDAGQLAARFPWLDTAGLVAGAFGARGEGWLDGALLLGLFQRAARDRGVTYLDGDVTGIDVTGIDVAGSRVAGVRLGDGQRIACGTLVNCAGPQAGAVAALAGIDLPVAPKKRFVFVLDVRDPPAGLARGPLVVDPSGVWFRPEGARFICGLAPTDPADEPPPGDLDAIDHDWFNDRIWPNLALRVPAFSAIKVTGAWAGHYDDNAFDHNAVIGPHPDVANFYFCNGFSGHGLQHAAAAGRALAELVIDGRFVTLDLARFGYDRLRRGAPIVELNVI